MLKGKGKVVPVVITTP